MKNNYGLVITTFSQDSDETKLVDALLSQKLAACIQVFNITSHYSWKGKINRDPEKIIFIKTKTSLYPKVEKCIRDNHTYEVPEIILLPVTAGLPEYLNWIDEVTG